MQKNLAYAILPLAFMLTGCFSPSENSSLGKNANGKEPIPPGLSKMKSRALLHSSDQQLSVWNYNSGLGGTMPDIHITLRWHDGNEIRDWRLFTARDSVGWVESIATFKTPTQTIYVLVSEGKWTTTSFSTSLSAFTIKKGEKKLQQVPGFFPPIPGASEDGSVIGWGYRRLRGVNRFPRPFEVRVDEDNHCLRVWIFPEAHAAPRYSLDKIKRQSFTLTLAGDKLTSGDFDDADREAIVAMTGY